MVDGVDVVKDLRKLRNEKRADIVGLIMHNPSGCGLSTRVGAGAEEAFFVVHHACAADYDHDRPRGGSHPGCAA